MSRKTRPRQDWATAFSRRLRRRNKHQEAAFPTTQIDRQPMEQNWLFDGSFISGGGVMQKMIQTLFSVVLSPCFYHPLWPKKGLDHWMIQTLLLARGDPNPPGWFGRPQTEAGSGEDFGHGSKKNGFGLQSGRGGGIIQNLAKRSFSNP